MKPIQTKLFKLVTEKVKQTTLGFDKNAQVILFGSRARGDYQKDSDWDFLILTNNPVDNTYKDNLRDNLYLTELEVEQVINTIIKNSTDWQKFSVTPLFENIKQEGVMI